METLEGLSFISIHDLSPQSRWLFVSDSVTDIIGYEPHELIGQSPFNYFHPEEVEATRRCHYETVKHDKAAAIAYLRVRHKEGHYLLLVTSRSVVHSVMIGTAALATPGPKAQMKAATAQEVLVLAPSPIASRFEFHKWNVNPGAPMTTMSEPPLSFEQLPKPSRRSGLILNRFSNSCPIMHCTDDNFLIASLVDGRSIYDFIAERDEAETRSWIDMAKGWGIEGPEPSEGGFSYARFHLCIPGRNSVTATQSATPSSRSMQLSRSSPSMQMIEENTQAQVDPTGAQPESNQLSNPITPLEAHVEAIISAHSDGLVVILKDASSAAGA